MSEVLQEPTHPTLARHDAFARYSSPSKDPPASAPIADKKQPTLQQHEAAAIIERHQRGKLQAKAHRESIEEERRRRAATIIETYQRGHASRSFSTLPRHRAPLRRSRPVRIVVCGNEWSGAAMQARMLASALDVPRARLDGHTVPGICSETSSWVLDGTGAHASAVAALQALPRAPTCWVLCTAADDALEEAGLTAVEQRAASSGPSRHGRGRLHPDADTDERRAHVRARVKAWKLRMVEVYEALPASAFVRIDTSDPSTEAMDAALDELIDAVVPQRDHDDDDDDDDDDGAKQRRAQTYPVRRRGGDEPPVPMGGAPQPSSTRRSHPSSDVPSSWPTASPLLREMPAAVPTTAAQALERVDSSTEDWRARSLLARLAKFSSSFVREHVPLEGHALVSIQHAALPTALTASWPRAAALRCLVTVVDEHGTRLAEVGEQSTPVSPCAPRQSEVWWAHELAIALPRSVLSRRGTSLQITLCEAATRCRLAVARKPLHDLVRQSVRAQAWERLDDDWTWISIGAFGDGQSGGNDDDEGGEDGGDDSPFAPTAYLHGSPLRALGVCRVNLVVLDVVTAFDELMASGQQEAACIGALVSELKVADGELKQLRYERDAFEERLARLKASFKAREAQLAIDAEARLTDTQSASTPQPHSTATPPAAARAVRAAGALAPAASKPDPRSGGAKRVDKTFKTVGVQTREKGLAEASPLASPSPAPKHNPAGSSKSSPTGRRDGATSPLLLLPSAPADGGVNPVNPVHSRGKLGDARENKLLRAKIASMGAEHLEKEMVESLLRAELERDEAERSEQVITLIQLLDDERAKAPVYVEVADSKKMPRGCGANRRILKGESSTPSVATAAFQPSPAKPSRPRSRTPSPPRTASPYAPASPPQGASPLHASPFIGPAAQPSPALAAPSSQARPSSPPKPVTALSPPKPKAKSKTKASSASSPAGRPQRVVPPPAFADAASFAKASADQVRRKGGSVGIAEQRRRDANIFQGVDLSTATAEEVPALMRAALRTKLARVTDVFRQIDDDTSGVIDAKEFAKGLRQLGLDAPDATMRDIFASFDADGSGQISYIEMDARLRRASPPRAREVKPTKRKKKVKKGVETVKHAAAIEERPQWDARTRVKHRDENMGRSSLGEPTMPFPLPWGADGAPGDSRAP